MFENVNLWFAKDENEKILAINEVNKETKTKYYCPLCGSQVVARQGEINSWCFAHIDASKCNTESMRIKNKLIEKGDKFTVKANDIREYVCKDILVEKSYDVDGKVYRPDLTIITEDSETIFFEMEYSNKKKLKDYIDIWMILGNTVVEVNTKTLINSQGEKIPLFNALWYDGKCFNVPKGEDANYHETIGNYKEKLSKSGEYEKRKIEIKKLDWFWNEVYNYKKEETPINDIMLFIDEIEYKELIYNILKKSKCNELKDEYEQYKTKTYKEDISRYIKYDYTKYGVRLIIGKNGVNKRIRLKHTDRWNHVDEYLSNYLWKKFKYQNHEAERVINVITDKIHEENREKVKRDNYISLIGTILKEMYKNENIIKINSNLEKENVIYFEDINGVRSIICYHVDDCNYIIKEIESKDNRIVDCISLHNMDLENLIREGFYIVLRGTKYDICYKDSCYIDFECKYKSSTFNNKQINLTFNKNKDYKRLDRFNFIDCNEKLKLLIKEQVKPFIRKQEEIFDDEVKKKVFVNKYNNKDVCIDEIDETIKKYLYPMYYLTSGTDMVNISLNCDFAKDVNGKYRPWLIKDFIETLELLGITNVSNIKSFKSEA